MPGRLPALMGLALLLLTGCAADGPAAGEALVVISGPRTFESFELLDEQDRVVWRLAARPPAPVSELVYGEVPTGFEQEAPAGGEAPRALMAGELLRLESVTPLRVFRHEGWVSGTQQMTIDYWEMQLRQPPETPPMDEPAAPSYE